MLTPLHMRHVSQDSGQCCLRVACEHAWDNRSITVRRWAVQASVRQSRELQAEWQHKYMSIQGESAIMKHELDDVRHLSSSMSQTPRGVGTLNRPSGIFMLRTAASCGHALACAPCVGTLMEDTHCCRLMTTCGGKGAPRRRCSSSWRSCRRRGRRARRRCRGWRRSPVSWLPSCSTARPPATPCRSSSRSFLPASPRPQHEL